MNISDTSVADVADYDAPLSEAGDITEKYKMMREVILSNAPPSSCKF